MSGCRSPQELPAIPVADIDEFKVDEVLEVVTINFNKCPFPLAVRQLCEQVKYSFIVPDSDLTINANFENVPFADAVRSICEQAQLSCNFSDHFVLIYGGEQVRHNFVYRGFVSDDFKENIKTCFSQDVSVSYFDGILTCSDTFQHLLFLRQILEARNYRTLFCEIWTVKTTLKTAIEIEAKLKLSGDIFHKSFTACLSADPYLSGSFDDVEISDSCQFFLTSGKPVTFKNGTSLQYETRNVSSEGYTSTAGFQEFNDGFEITLCATDNLSGVIVDSNLKISKYRDIQSGSVPPNDQIEFINKEVFLHYGNIGLICSYQEKSNSKGAVLFGGSAKNENNVFLVFCRITNVSKERNNFSR